MDKKEFVCETIKNVVTEIAKNSPNRNAFKADNEINIYTIISDLRLSLSQAYDKIQK